MDVPKNNDKILEIQFSVRTDYGPLLDVRFRQDLSRTSPGLEPPDRICPRTSADLSRTLTWSGGRPRTSVGRRLAYWVAKTRKQQTGSFLLRVLPLNVRIGKAERVPNASAVNKLFMQ